MNKRKGSDDDISGSDQIFGGHVDQSSGGGQYGAATSAYGNSQGYGGSQGYEHSETQDDSGGGYEQSDSRRHDESEPRRYGDWNYSGK